MKVFGPSWIRLISGFLLHCQVFGIFFKMPNTWLSLFQRRYGFNPRSTVLELWYFAERIELRIRQNIGRSFCVGEGNKDQTWRDRSVNAGLQCDRAAPRRDLHRLAGVQAK